MQDKWYSVRMRAAQGGAHENGGKHISGGEMLTKYESIKESVNLLLDKALLHSRGNPDFMQIQFEVVDKPVEKVKPLSIRTNNVDCLQQGHQVVRQLLEECGIPIHTIQKAYHEISENSGIRGAILIDTHTGKRVDDRNLKGIRVSRMDWKNDNFKDWAKSQDLPCNPRIKEAVTLATKVCHHPATVAELCWSDDPEYITGYVASIKKGYHRISKLKEYGDEQGCRIFFIDCQSINLSTYIDYLEKQPILIEQEDKNDK